MTAVAPAPRAVRRAPARRRRVTRLPTPLARRFEAVVFDWDGTAVPDRQANARRLRRLVEELCELGLHLGVVTGTHVGNVDPQLGARPSGPGRLWFCVNRGSEVYRASEHGLAPVARREATPEEDHALDVAAEATVAELGRRGLRAEIVSQRLNRRKIDLIPEPEWADPPKARIGELLEAVQERLHAAGLAGLHEAVEIALDAGRAAGLAEPKVTSDAKHVEIGLTDKADSAGWLFGELERRGIGHGSVLVAGDEFGPLGGLPGSDSFLLVDDAARATAVSVGAEPTGVPSGVLALGGGPDRFLAVLADQLARRRGGAPPALDDDPEWTLDVASDPLLERVHESLFTIGDGRLGTSGARVFGSGLYEGDGPETALTACPVWQRLGGLDATASVVRRRLDLRAGMLEETVRDPAGEVRATLLSSLARPGTVALRAEGSSGLLRPGSSILPQRTGALELGADRECLWLRQGAGRGGLAAAAHELRRSSRSLERIGVFDLDPDRLPSAAPPVAALEAVRESGYEHLLHEHREAWGARWADADVRVDGDPELQLAVRFALFQLIGSVADEGEAAVGARGLSGPAYRGHVFWDSDVFVLPFLAATHPQAARSMLEYRIRRLPQARAAAKARDREGARFPWESADDGFDVTPKFARDRNGQVVAIRTGDFEEHIVADVAWAACTYADWTGDREFVEGPGTELLVETARYWASRIRYDRDGRGHIYGVVGPDEYHEPVDDNAFTNVIARWNLRRAAEWARGAAGVSEDERTAWLHAADALVDGYDAETRLYEQFAGFFRLEPLIIADLAPRRPIAADLLLGAERVEAAQVLKQADVLMLHHLVPDAVAPGSLEPNLDFYERRTAHGSSLSPAIHAALLARAGRPDEALKPLELAARIDLDDLTGTTAGGLHLATMGGLWQALVFGFVGIRPAGEVLTLDPQLPEKWSALELRLQFRGCRVGVRVERDAIRVASDSPIAVSLAHDAPVSGTDVRFVRRHGAWEVADA